jgi:hypothetical protein
MSPACRIPTGRAIAGRHKGAALGNVESPKANIVPRYPTRSANRERVQQTPEAPFGVSNTEGFILLDGRLTVVADSVRYDKSFDIQHSIFDIRNFRLPRPRHRGRIRRLDREFIG